MQCLLDCSHEDGAPPRLTNLPHKHMYTFRSSRTLYKRGMTFFQKDDSQ